MGRGIRPRPFTHNLQRVRSPRGEDGSHQPLLRPLRPDPRPLEAREERVRGVDRAVARVLPRVGMAGGALRRPRRTVRREIAASSLQLDPRALSCDAHPFLVKRIKYRLGHNEDDHGN